jgi:hypothetical protein
MRIVGFVTQIKELFLGVDKSPRAQETHKPQRISQVLCRSMGRRQGSGVMIKTAYAIAIAAIAASVFVAFPSLSPQVGASAPVVGAKGDRADIRPLGTECGEKAWPYFDAACTRDGRVPLAQPRDIRMIAAEPAAQ